MNENDTALGRRIRRVLVYVSAFLMIVFIIALTIDVLGDPPRIFRHMMAKENIHFRPAIIGLPAAIFVALVIVSILETISGDMKIELPFGFKFEGASGPMIFWIICFLVIVAGIKLLWPWAHEVVPTCVP